VIAARAAVRSCVMGGDRERLDPRSDPAVRFAVLGVVDDELDQSAPELAEELQERADHPTTSACLRFGQRPACGSSGPRTHRSRPRRPPSIHRRFKGSRTGDVAGVSGVEHHRLVLAALSDRVVVEAALHGEAELEGIVECIERDRDDLLAAGIDLTSWGANPNDGIVEVDIVAADADRAQRTLTSRYGPLVRVVEWWPAWRAEKPRAFGSWSAEGRMLEVFYGVGHNGEAPERCEVIDGDDEIVITDMIAGIQTLVGGYRRLSAQVQLAAPLGSRRVIDGSCGEPRPYVAQLRQRHAHS